MRSTLCRRVDSFTLSELLCVIAILGILFALNLGAISRAKIEAQKAVCRISARQNELALKMEIELTTLPVQASCYNCHASAP